MSWKHLSFIFLFEERTKGNRSTNGIYYVSKCFNIVQVLFHGKSLAAADSCSISSTSCGILRFQGWIQATYRHLSTYFFRSFVILLLIVEYKLDTFWNIAFYEWYFEFYKFFVLWFLISFCLSRNFKREAGRQGGRKNGGLAVLRATFPPLLLEGES